MTTLNVMPIRDKSWFEPVNIVLLIALCALTLYPFWYVLVLSLNEGKDAATGPIWFWPREFTLDNYKYVIRNPYLIDAFYVTIARCVIGSLISVSVTFMVAFAISHRTLPGRKAILYYYMMPMFIGGSVVSNYVVMAKLGLINNFLVYVLPGAFAFFNMIIMRTFIEQIPGEMQESAMIDGAGKIRILWSIIIPLSKPILAAMLFFSVVGGWLDFGANLLYVTKRSMFVLQYVLYMTVLSSQSNEMLQLMSTSGRLPTNVATSLPTPEVLKMSTLVVVTLPLLFVYPFFQKYFVKGMMVGAIKA